MSSTTEISENSYIEKFYSLGMWTASKIKAQSWLLNFTEEDRKLAQVLLKNFLFFSDVMTDSLFNSSIHNISNIISNSKNNNQSRIQLWNDFLNRCYIVPIEGDTAHPTDSGNLFARKAKKNLHVSEDKIINYREVIRIFSHGLDFPILFVDDFIGSGNQFIENWHKRISDPPRCAPASLAIDALRRKQQNLPYREIYICCAVACEKGLNNIKQNCPGVTISAGSLLSEDYNLIENGAHWWGVVEQQKMFTFIQKVSSSLGYSDDDGQTTDWRGYNKLGLGIAFEHGTPDATLPIFRHSSHNNSSADATSWVPLVE